MFLQEEGPKIACLLGSQMQLEPSIKFPHLTRLHPCFSSDASNKKGRIHLPLAPACNLRCSFCQRSLSDQQERPGVARTLLEPEEAVNIVERPLSLCPEIAVVGVAGPGDPLASHHALRALALVHRRFPDLIKCLSTNGLLLAERTHQIKDVGVRAVTVTVNAVEPKIQAQIAPEIFYHGKRICGEAGARFLIHKQLGGIGKACSYGLLVKVNLVLIPELNGYHIGDVARACAAVGASLINIIPLIPQYRMANCRAPDCYELNMARENAEKYLPVFRHCQRCRADAAGIPGVSEFRKELYDVLFQSHFASFSHG